ncbi:MAG: hypothetical protein IJW05_02260 [Lentisphaeria bacterium]|nr:hypothetical protein [Lentisphaeria bacterium]
MKKVKLSALLMAAVFSLALNGQNLIEDGSFENGVSHWKAPSWKRGDDKLWLSPTADKTVSQGAGGSNSLKLDWTDKYICYVWYDKEIALNGLTEVELSFWAKSAGYDGTNIIEIMVNFPEVKDPKKKNVSLGNPWNRTPADWTFFKQQIKVPAGATKAKLCIRIHGFKSTKGNSWVDNVYFGAVQKNAGDQQGKK